MTRFEKTLIVLVIAWIVQAASNSIITVVVKSDLVEAYSKGPIYVRNVISLYSGISELVSFLSKAVFGYWLYIVARNENEKKWVWCLVGVFGGIYGILIFYPYLILKELRSKKDQGSS